jgi:branched-chain amino acid transport system substrate-binding protein
MKQEGIMIRTVKLSLIVLSVLSLVFLTLQNPSTAFAAKAVKKAKPIQAEEGYMGGKANAGYEFSKMGDMSDFDPSNPIVPTGDTIKIAIVASFSGPGAINGSLYWHCVQWAAHDINKRGGIFVDGKKKLVQVIKADHMSKVDQCKKICERMILQENVHVLWGTDGSHLMKVINETASKNKVIAVNASCLSDDLQNADNFSRYAFQTAWSTGQAGRSLAYFYGQVRKKEKKFYILCQDYSFGHQLAESFRKGLQEYYPAAEIVGEDFHKLFLTDFAPYLTKVKASGAEVVFTGDWMPDAGNLLKQARQMGMMLPFANVYMDEPNMLSEVGDKGTTGLINVNAYTMSNPQFKTLDSYQYFKVWDELWKNKWKTPPHNSKTFQAYRGNYGVWTHSVYWLLSVMERAQSTDPEKIIPVWENDTYRYENGKVVKMRGCDHKAVQDLTVTEFVPWQQQKISFNYPPYYWRKECTSTGPTCVIPAGRILPWMDQKLDRCKGKSEWGE